MFSLLPCKDRLIHGDYRIKVNPYRSVETMETRLELLRSFAHELCNAPKITNELTAIRKEVDAAISSKSDMVKDAL